MTMAPEKIFSSFSPEVRLKQKAHRLLLELLMSHSEYCVKVIVKTLHFTMKQKSTG